MKPPAQATIASVAAIGSSAIAPDMKVRMFIAHLQGCLAGRAPAEILTRHNIASAVCVGRNSGARSPRCRLFASAERRICRHFARLPLTFADIADPAPRSSACRSAQDGASHARPHRIEERRPLRPRSIHSRETQMRVALTVALTLLATLVIDVAEAKTAPWCAVYGFFGATNCGFYSWASAKRRFRATAATARK